MTTDGPHDSPARPGRPSVLITGGGTGIGFATAAALHRDGYALTLVGRRAEVLAGAVARLRGGSGDGDGDTAPVHTHIADLADPDAAQAIVDTHAERCAGIDALVAGAGAYEDTPSMHLDAASWDATLDVHLRGAALTASAAARHMARAGRGRIVLLSSVNGLHSEPSTVAYSAAKTAIISVARSLAVDLAGHGVIANAVAPGWVTSPMTEHDLAASTEERMQRLNPLGRAGTVEEVANVIRYLIAEAPEFLTGSTIVVDGGQTALAPLP